MDKQILTALTDFIYNEIQSQILRGSLFKVYINDVWITMEKDNVQSKWKEFEKLAKADDHNFETICRDLKSICKNDSFDFDTPISTEVSTYENFVKLLLIKIDNEQYKMNGKKELMKDGRVLSLANMESEIEDRSKFVKSRDLSRSISSNVEKIQYAREARNNKAHADAKTLKDYIDAWFILTLIFNHIKNVAAGFVIDIDDNTLKELKDNESIGIQVLCEDIEIYNWTKIRNNITLYIPIQKKYYGGNKTDVSTTIKVDYGFGKVKQTTINIPKRQFNKNSVWIDTLKKGTDGSNNQNPAYGIIVQGNQIANIIKVGDPLETSGERIRTIPQLKPNQPINIWIYKHTQSGDMTPIASLTDSEKEPVLKKTIRYSEAVNNETVTLKCTRDKSGKVKLEVTWGDGHDITELL